MKVCSYCSTTCDSTEENCPSCGAVQFKTQCDHCQAVYEGAFCPTCGMAANDALRTCPKCGTRSHKLFCPECGASMLEGVDYAPLRQPRVARPYAPPAQPPVYAQPRQAARPQSYVQPPPPAPQQAAYAQMTVTAPAARPVITYTPYRKLDKWVAFLLCLFVGVVGAHKFYEGKFGMGLLYLFTGGLFGIGWFVDLIVLLTKPNPYYLPR